MGRAVCLTRQDAPLQPEMETVHCSLWMRCDEMWSTCKFQCTTPKRRSVLKPLDPFEGSTGALRNRVTADQEQCLAYHQILSLYIRETWISPPFLGENMTGWNTSNDMWDWIQLCSHTFWVRDFKHSLFTSVPSESGQAPGWWVERKRDKQHWLVTHKTWVHMDQHKDIRCTVTKHGRIQDFSVPVVDIGFCKSLCYVHWQIF